MTRLEKADAWLNTLCDKAEWAERDKDQAELLRVSLQVKMLADVTPDRVSVRARSLQWHLAEVRQYLEGTRGTVSKPQVPGHTCPAWLLDHYRKEQPQ